MSTLTSSHIGFGCSGLMSRLDRKESRRLLETAFDNGITHYDVARSYGHGEAESVVGDFVASRRSAVTVTTKAGILPPRRTKLLSAARGMARYLVAIHPSFRRRLRGIGQAMASSGRFDVASIQQSIEISLRELRTDYVDFLLLHDCGPTDVGDPELLHHLAALQSAGKILRFGVGTSFEAAAATHRAHPAMAQVVQFPNNPWHPNMTNAGWASELTIFTHSAVGSAFAKISSALEADAALGSRWSNQLGFDAMDRRKLGAALLAAALAANPMGCVLFSSQQAETIAANAKVVPRPDFWLTLRELVKTAPGYSPA